MEQNFNRSNDHEQSFWLNCYLPVLAKNNRRKKKNWSDSDESHVGRHFDDLERTVPGRLLHKGEGVT